MTFRLTAGYLQAKIDTANRLLGFDPDNDKWGTVGALQLSGGYGGHAVHKVINESLGVSDLSRGYKTAREVACYLDGFIEALRQVQEGKMPAMMQPVTQEPDTEQLYVIKRHQTDSYNAGPPVFLGVAATPEAAKLWIQNEVDGLHNTSHTYAKGYSVDWWIEYGTFSITPTWLIV